VIFGSGISSLSGRFHQFSLIAQQAGTVLAGFADAHVAGAEAGSQPGNPPFFAYPAFASRGAGDGRTANQVPAAVGRGHLRASHADREQVIGTLKVAFVQGMLAKDEFDLRVGQAFAARTYAELASS